MNKPFPWGIVASLVAISLISIGGGYLLYRIIDGPSPIKMAVSPEKRDLPATPDTKPASVTALSEAEGFLVIHLRASVEMSPDTGIVAYDTAVENRGFSQECPGKVVSTDLRAQGKDYWSEEEGAIAEADSLICLPATSKAFTGAFSNESSDARVVLDDDDALEHPTATLEGKGRAVFLQTGKAGYLLYAGGVTVKDCDSGCDAGAAAGVSVTRVSRALSEDRFVFSVPAGDAKVLTVAVIIPVTQ